MNDNSDEIEDSMLKKEPGITGLLLVRIASLAFLMAIVFVLLPLTLSFFAKSHWALDLLAQFNVQYALLLIPVATLCLLARFWKRLTIVAAGIAVAIAPVVPYLVPRADRELQTANADHETLRLISLNVLTSNNRYQDVVDFVRDESADIVVMYEIDEDWEHRLTDLRNDYPHVSFRSRQDNFGVCVFSKINCREISLADTGPSDLPSVNLVFEFNGSTINLIGTHPLPPAGRRNSDSRNEQLLEVAGSLSKQHERILAGDFNLAPYSPWFSDVCRIADVRDSAVGYGPAPTWYRFPTILGGIKIDHVLVSPGLDVVDYRVSEHLGSDHRAVIVDLAVNSATQSTGAEKSPK